MNPDLPPDIHLTAGRREYRSRLLAWFDRVRRPLPWRLNRSLYGTWIAEMMLQQTTVATVVPYYEKFLAVFPDVRALAAAPVEEVLSLWSGLGYYRRARHLHEAAVEVVERLAGELPTDRQGWLALPGVGPYASGAIASMGLGHRVPAIDANARRVLSRWLVADPGALDKLRPAHLELIGGQLVCASRPGDWNEAVMELGALVCRATDPGCRDCPVGTLCRAGRAQTADRIPLPTPRTATTRVRLGLLALLWGDRVLLVPPSSLPVAEVPGGGRPVRADVTGLHRDLWGLPSTPWLAPPRGGSTPLPGRIWHPFLKEVAGVQLAGIKEEPVLVGSFSHAVTRYRLAVEVYGLRLEDERPEGGRYLPTASGFDTGNGGAGGAVEVPMAPGAARFSRWPDPRRPVSNLVNKTMALVVKRRV